MKIPSMLVAEAANRLQLITSGDCYQQIGVTSQEQVDGQQYSSRWRG
jgi:hypothetical protein